jgi:hypothetical protein
MSRGSRALSDEVIVLLLSQLRPMPDDVVVDVSEFSNLGIVAAEAMDQSLDRIIHVESYPSRKRVLDHALHPEEGADARAPRDRSDLMQASRRVENEMARGQLDPVGTIVIVDL